MYVVLHGNYVMLSWFGFIRLTISFRSTYLIGIISLNLDFRFVDWAIQGKRYDLFQLSGDQIHFQIHEPSSCISYLQLIQVNYSQITFTLFREIHESSSYISAYYVVDCDRVHALPMQGRVHALPFACAIWYTEYGTNQQLVCVAIYGATAFSCMV